MRFARRKWGWWIVLLDRPSFKLKLLRFRKKGALSMQKHYLRSELWLFLKGGGLFLGQEDYIAPSAGDYHMIEQKAWHKFIADKVTWVLEVQYGVACKESDIERKDENI